MEKKEEEMGAEERAEAVGKAFMEHYYQLFDTNRAALGGLYHPTTSMMSFEGHKVMGADSIARRLAQLPFEQCKHSVTTVDCQPSPPLAGVLVFVSGNIQLAGEDHLLKFSQMFQLIPTEQGSFFVQNDIFRLNYC